MKHSAFCLLAVELVIASIAITSAYGQGSRPALPPLPYPVLQNLIADPAAWRQFLAEHPAPPFGARSTEPASAALQPITLQPINGLAWTPLKNLLPPDDSGNPQSASNPLLLTDGTVLVHVACTNRWYRLKPSPAGSYLNGTWSLVAPMVDAMSQPYAPVFLASAVLPDGRVIVEGGEYNGCLAADSAQGEIYDPRTNTWTPLPPPSGWTHIGDASATVLGNGTFLLANATSEQAALLNAATLTWTATGRGKFDSNNEENWTLLPNGDVLTVDAYRGAGTCGTNSEKYKLGSGWSSAGSSINFLAGCSGSIADFEAPTQILRPNGSVAVFGATASLASQNYPVYTGIYNTRTQAWTAGPNMPQVGGVNYTMADAPAAILPNGNVLIAASPSLWAANAGYPSPTHFFIFDGEIFAQVGDVADSAILNSFEMNFLVLPTGEILGVETYAPNMEIFPASADANHPLVCCSKAAWAPSVTYINGLTTFPVTLVNGQTNTISGTQFNGLTSGAAYGDDEQASTNYPLVRVTNATSGVVTYCATFNFSSMGVATGSTSVSADFTCNAPNGPSTLEVVANGIASAAVEVTIKTQAATTLYSFCAMGVPDCTDGRFPSSSLIMDSSRNLYGTTANGGASGSGTIFELPYDPVTGQYASAVKTLYSFCTQGGSSCTDGAFPLLLSTGGLLIDASGNLYGTTFQGGATGSDGGTVFELTFNSTTRQYASAVQTLYSFCSQGGNCTDGYAPTGGLIRDASGNLYGTTSSGGTGTIAFGTVFELPFHSTTKQYASAVQTLYNFCSRGGFNCTDGSDPQGSLLFDASGNLYGTTEGEPGSGDTVFELPYDSETGQYAPAITLYTFCSQANCIDGSFPGGSLVMDASGNLFGTTNGGGAGSAGTVFELPVNSSTHQYASAVQTLYSFCSQPDCSDGSYPGAGVIMDASGNLYGTTGGSTTGQNAPTVFELSLNPKTNLYANAVQTLYNLLPFGSSLLAPLLLDGLSGTLYGTSNQRGAFGAGSVFTLTH
jgi:uncharacterized repeat protein (TIGR03803 family)